MIIITGRRNYNGIWDITLSQTSPTNIPPSSNTPTQVDQHISTTTIQPDTEEAIVYIELGYGAKKMDSAPTHQ